MSLVVHNYNASLLYASQHEGRILERARRLISGGPGISFQRLDVHAEKENTSELDDRIHWDGSRPPAIGPKLAGGDNNKVTVEAFVSTSISEDEDGGYEIEDGSDRLFFVTRTSAPLTKSKIPLMNSSNQFAPDNQRWPPWLFKYARTLTPHSCSTREVLYDRSFALGTFTLSSETSIKNCGLGRTIPPPSCLHLVIQSIHGKRTA